MKACKVIKFRLTNFAGVTALVGAAPNDRIYPLAMPQVPVYPAITYKQVDSNRLMGTYDDPGVANVTVQVVAWAKTFDEVKALTEQIRLALERFGTAITGTPIDGVTVYDIKMGSDADGYIGELDIFFITTDFTVTHVE